MTRLSLRLTMAAALLLAALLVWSVARLDEARRWNLEIDRGAAVMAARAAAAQLGVSAADWQVRAASRLDETLAAVLATVAGTDLDPVRVDVRLREPQGRGDVLVTVDGTGRLVSYELRASGTGAARDAAVTPRDLVRRAVALTVGEGAPGFEPVDEASAQIFAAGATAEAGAGGRVLRWRRAPAGAMIAQELEVHVEGGEVLEVALTATAIAVPAPWTPDPQPLTWALVILAALVYAVQARRYAHPHRGPLLVGALAVVWASFRLAFAFDQQILEAGSVIGLLFARLPRSVLVAGLPAVALFGGGLAAAWAVMPGRWLTAEEALRGIFATRAAGRALVLGATAGLGLALVPYAVAAVLPPGLLLVSGGDAATAAARWPSLAVLMPPVSIPVFAFVVFVLPLLAAVLSSSVLARILGLATGMVILAVASPVGGELLAVLAVGLLLALGFQSLLERIDLLAALAAGYTALVAPRVAALLIQPGPVRWSGLFAVGLLAVLALLARRWAIQGSAPTLTPDDLVLERRLRAERERLRAQLSVAREAQSRMLPPAPPAIQGLSISAICRPASEVGGDLYDFIPVEGGRWGLAVGDVSGKGMVASLYMTLTKGLLLAAAEHREGPLDILREVNRGLLRETDRGTFVTLAYGVLDPATGRWRHARAGHNPVLWRRARRWQTMSLRPRGLALGVVGDSLFEAAMAEEEQMLEPGDALFLYTDGLTEAMDEDRREYGEERLRAAVGRTDGLDADAAREVVLADVVAFMGDAPPHDDLTLVVVRYEGPASDPALPATGAGR